jgi:hypothetical protein
LLIDASHRKWIVATVVLFIASTASYVYYHLMSLNAPSGGTWPGLAYGIVSTAFIVFCALLGVRRKFPTMRVGRAQAWMKAHIWLGLLSYPLIYFHAGFQFGGVLTWVLMILFTLVILSGIFGVIAQHLIPRVMTERVGVETIYEQIDHVLGQLVDEGDRAITAVAGELFPEPVPVGAAAGAEGAKEHAPKKRGKVIQPLEGSGDLKAFYLEIARPFLQGTGGGPLASSAERSAIFEQVRIQVPPPLHRTVIHIEEICEERRQLLLQRRLHHWLHGWLYVHLPLTVALIVLTAVHAVMALRY